MFTLINNKITGNTKLTSKTIPLHIVLEGVFYSGDEPLYKAARLLKKLSTGTFFEDGNKRTAWITTCVYLNKWGYVLTEKNLSEIENLIITVANYDLFGETIAEKLNELFTDTNENN